MTEERTKEFWNHVSKTRACWEWTAGCDSDGYGSFWTGEADVRAYRVSYALWFGEIQPGVQVLHRCDNRKCVRPTHLFAGSNFVNQLDKVSKGRQAKREQNGRSKLSISAIAKLQELRLQGQSNRQLARIFDLNESTIRRALSGVTWL